MKKMSLLILSFFSLSADFLDDVFTNKPSTYMRNLDPQAKNRFFIRAVADGNLEKASQLLDAGADINGGITSGPTPLMIAAEMKNLATFKFLLNYNPDIFYQTSGDWLTNTVMRRAATAGLAFAQALDSYVRTKADAGDNKQLLIKLQKEKDAALLVFSNYPDLQPVAALLAIGADPNATTEEKESALTKAVAKGNGAIAQALLNAGANIDAKDIYGTTILQATLSGLKPQAMLELLVNHAAQKNMLIKTINFEQAPGMHILLQAIHHPDEKAVLILLKIPTININAADREGKTVLMWAAQQGKSEVVNALIQAGAKLNMKDAYERTALDYAKSPDIIAALKDAGALRGSEIIEK